MPIKHFKKALAEAPALGSPNLAKPFVLYMSKRKEIIMGVLTPKLGTETHTVAYISKKLVGIALGWPGYLKAIVAYLHCPVSGGGNEDNPGPTIRSSNSLPS
jgi:hypothetical protein